jgi:hypothetical protein
MLQSLHRSSLSQSCTATSFFRLDFSIVGAGAMKLAALIGPEIAAAPGCVAARVP